jgi:mRNA interferase MazF
VEGVRRGDLVTIAVGGDYGKPRPAVIIQSNVFDALSAVTVLRLSGELHDWPTFRVTVLPSAENGLRQPSQVMIDRAVSLPREKVGGVFGRVDEATMRMVSRTLVAFLGLDEVAG